MTGGNNLFDTEDFENQVGADESHLVDEAAETQVSESPASFPVQAAPASPVVTRTASAVRAMGAPRRVVQAGAAVKFRTRPMPNVWRSRLPTVKTMLITNEDGTQIMFVR